MPSSQAAAPALLARPPHLADALAADGGAGLAADGACQARAARPLAVHQLGRDLQTAT